MSRHTVGVHVAAWPCGVIVDMAGPHTEYCLLNTEYGASLKHWQNIFSYLPTSKI